MSKPAVKVAWYQGWHTDVSTALQGLQEMATCPHALLQELLELRTRSEKLAAVASLEGEPLAVFGLTRRDRHWQPVGEIPNALGAGTTGHVVSALPLLDKYVRVWSWRHELPKQRLQHVERIPDYIMPTTTDWDATWRELHNTPHLNRSRNRCDRLGDVEFEIDHPESVAWTIARWADKWRGHYSDMDSIVADLSTTANHLVNMGRYHSFRLTHKGRPVAGSNWFADGDRLVLHTTVYEPTYATYGVGVRMTELVFRWSSQSKFRYIGLGAGGDYKERWLKPTEHAANFSVMPARLAAAYRAKEFVDGMVNYARRLRQSQSAEVIG